MSLCTCSYIVCFAYIILSISVFVFPSPCNLIAMLYVYLLSLAAAYIMF